MLQADLVIRNRKYTVACDAIDVNTDGTVSIWFYNGDGSDGDMCMTKGRTTIVNIFQISDKNKNGYYIPENLPLGLKPEKDFVFIGLSDNQVWRKK